MFGAWEPWQLVVFGIAIGWGIEWVIDWFYWRRHRAELAELRAQVTQLNGDLTSSRKLAAEVGPLREQLATCRTNGEQLQTEIGGLRPQIAELRAANERLAADLTGTRALAEQRQNELNGLNSSLGELQIHSQAIEAELGTVSDLATRRQAEIESLKASSTDLHAEIERLKAELASPGSSSENRRDLLGSLKSLFGGLGIGAGAGAATLGGDNDDDGDLEGLRAGVVALRDENAQLKAELASAQQAISTQQSGFAVLAPTLAAVRSENDTLKTEVGGFGQRLTQLNGLVRDPLIDIDGIGPVYERRLFDAGIYTFEDLAEADPKRIAAIVELDDAAEVDLAAVRAWQDEARQFAAREYPDPLIAINGVGPVYEQKLNDAGITTFNQLAALSPEQVTAIVQPEAWQQIDAAAWIDEARQVVNNSATSVEGRISRLLGKLPRIRNETRRLRGELGEVNNRHQTQTAGFAVLAPTLAAVRSENDTLRGELAQLQHELAALKGARRDPLIDINGIGPVYEKKLFDAGVTTFRQLASLTPEQVNAIIKPQSWQELDYAAWIAEAAQFADQRERSHTA